MDITLAYLYVVIVSEIPVLVGQSLLVFLFSFFVDWD
jgi:hypothetical protein